MLEKIIKDYFSFTRKERVAVIILACLVIIIFLLPTWIPESSQGLDKTGFDTLRVRLGPSPAVEADQARTTHKGQEVPIAADRKSVYSPGWKKKEEPTQKFDLFYFDPNTLPAEGWKKLGLRDRTIATIKNYISKGGRFNDKEDIGKIYGLHANEAALLMPYVKISGNKTIIKTEHTGKMFSLARATVYSSSFKKSSLPVPLVDINTGDSTAWIALPGIGSKLAARILHFREKLGGFYSIDQVSEIYGLPDSTFQLIRPFLTISNTMVSFININTAQANDLKQHPYINWNVANAIVEYRNQHGSFKSPEDLRKVDPVTEELYRKIVPYLKIE